MAGTGLTASANLTVATPLSIASAFGATTVALNGSTSLTFTINNPNAFAANGVAFAETLPSGLVVTTPNGISSTCNGTATAVAASGSVSLSAGTITASGSCAISINVTGTTAGLKSKRRHRCFHGSRYRQYIERERDGSCTAVDQRGVRRDDDPAEWHDFADVHRDQSSGHCGADRVAFTDNFPRGPDCGDAERTHRQLRQRNGNRGCGRHGGSALGRNYRCLQQLQLRRPM